MDCSLPGSSVHGDSPGKNTGVGCHFLLQGIFPTPGSNLRLPHWQADSVPLSHLESTTEYLKYAIFFLQLYIVTSSLLNIRIVSEGRSGSSSVNLSGAPASDISFTLQM